MHPLLPRLGASRRTALRAGAATLTYAELDRAARAHVARLREDGDLGRRPGRGVGHPASGDGRRPGGQRARRLRIRAAQPRHRRGGAGARVARRRAACRACSRACAVPLAHARRAGDRLRRTRGLRSRLRAGARRPAAGPLHVGARPDRRRAPSSPTATPRSTSTGWPPPGGGPRTTCSSHALPLFHVHGLVLGVFGTLRVGARLELLPRFAPDGGLRRHGGRRDDALRGADHVPPARRARRGDSGRRAAALAGAAPRLRLGGLAGARERPAVAALRAAPVERYGLTETLIVCAARGDGPRTPGTVGPPLPGLELKLVDDQRQAIAARAPTCWARWRCAGRASSRAI